MNKFFSVFLRATDGSLNATILIADRFIPDVAVKTVKLTTSWQRYEVWLPPTFTSIRPFIIRDRAPFHDGFIAAGLQVSNGNTFTNMRPPDRPEPVIEHTVDEWTDEAQMTREALDET